MIDFKTYNKNVPEGSEDPINLIFSVLTSLQSDEDKLFWRSPLPLYAFSVSTCGTTVITTSICHYFEDDLKLWVSDYSTEHCKV